MKLYRIRRKSDGKFSNGTMEPKFTKNGKFWLEPDLKRHLKQFDDKDLGRYFDCEIMCYMLIDVIGEKRDIIPAVKTPKEKIINKTDNIYDL